MTSTPSDHPKRSRSGRASLNAERADDRPRVGFLFPTVPAIVEQKADGSVELVDLSRSWRLVVEGPVAEQTVACISKGEWGPELEKLGPDHPLVEALARLQPQRRKRLCAAASLPLSGFDTLYLTLTSHCASHCLHCALPQQHRASDLSLPYRVAAELLEDAAEMGLRRVLFSGGEPLSYEHLLELVRLARELGIADVEIHTSGLLLSETLLRDLAAFDPTFAVAIFSHDRTTHERITRTVGSHRRTVDTLERVSHLGLAVRASIAVLDSNARHVIPTVDLLQTMGVRQIALATALARPGRGRRERTMGRCGSGCSVRGICRSRYVDVQGQVFQCLPGRAGDGPYLGRVPERRLRELQVQACVEQQDRPGPVPVSLPPCATFASAGCQALAYIVGSI